MAAVTTMKCSARRTALRRIQSLINELIQVNEAADRLRIQLLAASVDTAEVEDAVNKVLAGGGPTDVTTAATSDTITDNIISMLAANTTPPPGQVGWLYDAE